jgi:hypothetical protein
MTEQSEFFEFRPLIWHRPRRAKGPEPDKHKDRRAKTQAVVELFRPVKRDKAKREKKTA